LKSKLTRHIISCLLIGILFIPNLSSFIPEDANQDRKIDLKDAVLMLQIFDRAAAWTDKEHSEKTFQTCVNTIKAVAGLKELFLPQEDDGNSCSADLYPLIANFAFNNISVFYENISETTSLYDSYLITPPSPPPLNA